MDLSLSFHHCSDFHCNLIAILTIAVLLHAPRLSNIEYAPNTTASQNVIEIKFESEVAFWIAEANISVNGCDSNVIVVQRRPCSSLPTTDRRSTELTLDLLFYLTSVYFLENSSLNLSVIDDDVSRNPNASIWMLNKRDYLKFRCDNNIKQDCNSTYECPGLAGESCCYHTNEHAGRNILHQIMKPGFYYAIPKPCTHTFFVSYTAVVYDLNATLRLPDADVFLGNAKISNWFDFHSAKCILLNSSCSARAPGGISGFHSITLSNISKRFDILVLALLLVLLASIILIVLVVVGLILAYKLTSLKGKLLCRKRTLEELEPSTTALIESNTEDATVYSVTISKSAFQTEYIDIPYYNGKQKVN